MDDIGPTLDEIATSLGDITIEPASLVKLTTQGFMSLACAIDSSAGPAVLHIVRTPVQEQLLQKVPEKIHAISDFLMSHPHIPTARVLAHGFLQKGGYFMLQERMPGTTLGSQTIQNDEIVRTYTAENATSVTADTERLLARLHELSPCPQFGHLTVDDVGNLTAPYTSWKDFIVDGSIRWLTELAQAKSADATFADMTKRAEEYSRKIQERFADVLAWDTPQFVHGDMLNPGNILADHGKVTALLDFEWSVSGDPAWEFAFTHEFPSPAYYEASGENRESFEKRKRVYRFFWLLWGTNVHTHSKDSFFRNWLLGKCIESAEELDV